MLHFCDGSVDLFADFCLLLSYLLLIFVSWLFCLAVLLLIGCLLLHNRFAIGLWCFVF